MIISVLFVLQCDDGGLDSPNRDFGDPVPNILELRWILTGVGQSSWARKTDQFLKCSLDNTYPKILAINDILAHLRAILILPGFNGPAFRARRIEFGRRRQGHFESRPGTRLRLPAQPRRILDLLGDCLADNRQCVYVRDRAAIDWRSRRKWTRRDGRSRRWGRNRDRRGRDTARVAGTPEYYKSRSRIAVRSVSRPIHRQACSGE